MHRESYLQRLPTAHERRLRWFADHRGAVVSWADIERMPPELRLATKAKGIYKPKDMGYALSVKETVAGEYPDLEVQNFSDGSWRYRYHQEGTIYADVERLYTNRGLTAAMRDNVPVGVIRQLSPKPDVKYDVLGLALVNGFTDGYFDLIGFSNTGEFPNEASLQVSPAIEEFESLYRQFAEDESTSEAIITLERTLTNVLARRGQANFRSALLGAYDNHCAITKYDAAPALEAAHIVPYATYGSNTVSNGLLLRADLHSLFDLGHVAVEPTSYRIKLSSELSRSSYSAFDGEKIILPQSKADWPSPEALAIHYKNSRLF